MLTAMLSALGRYVIGWYLGKSAIDSTFGASVSLVAVVLRVCCSAASLLLGADLSRAPSESAS